MLCVATSSHLWLKSQNLLLCWLRRLQPEMEKREVFLKMQGPRLLFHLLRREAVYTNFVISSKQPQMPFPELCLAPTSCSFSASRLPSFPFDFSVMSHVFYLLWPILQLKAVTLLPKNQTGCQLSSITISIFFPSRKKCLSGRQRKAPLT